MHKSITLEKLMEAVEADANAGFCTVCGHEHDGIEPDARKYECESCSAAAVYGAAELLLMGYGV